MLLAAGKIKCDQSPLPAKLAYINKTILRNTFDRGIASSGESRSSTTNLEECVRQREHGMAIIVLSSNVHLFVVAGNRQPRLRFWWAEAGIRSEERRVGKGGRCRGGK